MSKSRKFFGTDGVRGVYGAAVINEAFAARLGFAAARWADANGGGVAKRVLIGRDTRGSGVSLARAVASGIAAAGLEPVLLGVLPTPAVARTVREDPEAALGVVVTASHNPASDNGIKFFSGKGMKLPDADELGIEEMLDKVPPDFAGINGEFAIIGAEAERAYVEAEAALLPAACLKNWKIVLDTANGATTRTSGAVLGVLGAELVRLGAAPDGTNINAGVGSECTDLLAERVVEEGALLGIAHDGDGDRCVLCDERGVVLDGDELLGILATDALGRGELRGKTLVATVQSNLGLDAAVRSAGGRVLRTDVGDRYVLERMLQSGAMLGGESSGHVICGDVLMTGDGLTAALRVLGVMLRTGKKLSELRGVVKKFPSASRAVRVSERRPLEECAALCAEMRKLEAELGERGRVLVRFSGTEAKLRLLVEGESEEIVKDGVARLEAATAMDFGG